MKQIPKDSKEPLEFETTVHEGVCTQQYTVNSNPKCSLVYLPIRHEFQKKKIKVIMGELQIEMNNTTYYLKKDQMLEIKSNTDHTLSPRNDREIKFSTTIEPNLKYDRFLRNQFGIFKDSKNSLGFIDLIYLFKNYDDFNIRISFIPNFLWKMNSFFTKLISFVIQLPQEISEYHKN
eukprot:gene12139-5630_t